MSRARDYLVGVLKPLEPAFRVLPYARTIDPPKKPTVLVRVDKIDPTPNVARRVRTYTYGVIVVPVKSTGDPAEDELDACVEDVLAVLDDADDVQWSTAERAMWEDSNFPAYQITVTVPLKIGA